MSTYGDSHDSKMEAEDIEYVMGELKKSEESLRGHSRNKVRAKKHEASGRKGNRTIKGRSSCGVCNR